MPNIIDTSGKDYSSIKPIVLVDQNGNSISNPSISVIDTNSGQDFSSVKIITLVDTNGDSI